jgi:hypothetical protein
MGCPMPNRSNGRDRSRDSTISWDRSIDSLVDWSWHSGQPDAWESRLGQGWALLKLGDIYKESSKLPDAENRYQQVILSTDMLCERLRDQASATELNWNAGYALFDVRTGWANSTKGVN